MAGVTVRVLRGRENDWLALIIGIAVYVTTSISESGPAALVAVISIFKVVLLVPVGVPEITPVLVLIVKPVPLRPVAP